jgi:hypothetical protein
VWGNLSYERLVTTWISLLAQNGYFKGWDTKNGVPGIAPVKIALLYKDEPYTDAAYAVLKAELKRRGYDVVADARWLNPNDFSNYAVQFRAEGVTHLFLDSGAGLLYPPSAQAQSFHARYAVSSANQIQPIFQNTAPPAQLKGMMGVGWVPRLDIDLAHGPTTAGDKVCLKIMQDAGADVSKSNYRYVAEVSCDSFFLIVQMALRGGGLSPSDLFTGYSKVLSSFPWASNLGTGAATSDISSTPGVRALEWVESCKCVEYVGPYTKIP